MSERRCQSCGQIVSSTVVYCTNCGSLLPIDSGLEGGRTASGPATSAIRRPQQIKRTPVESRTFFSQFLGLIFYALTVTLAVVIVLALMEPNEYTSENPEVLGATAIVKQTLGNSRFEPAHISQQILNDFLRTSGRVQWNLPIPFFTPEWRASRVILKEGHLVYFLDLNFLNYPFHFSETFHIQGLPSHWVLVPDSGSIGLLHLAGPFLYLLTPVIASSTSPFGQELRLLEKAEMLRIHAGVLEFKMP